MKARILGVLALVLSGACTSERLETTRSELGLAPTGGSGSHFYWEAYQQQPYIYRGCPDPEPWAERATLHVARGTRMIELELGTAVPLELRGTDVPRGLLLSPHSRGVSIAVGDPFAGDRVGFTMLVSHRDCTYELGAEIAFGF